MSNISDEHQEILLESHSQVHCPFAQEESVYLACENGEVLQVVEGDVKIEFKCNGQPNAVVIDQQKETFYVTDMANQSVLAYTVGESSTNVLVRDYEGVSLIGPHSLCLSKRTGNIFFTDCGELAETSIQHPKVPYQPTVGKCLSHRCGAAEHSSTFSEMPCPANRYGAE